MTAWVIRSGRDNELEASALADGAAFHAWDEVPDLLTFASQDELGEALESLLPDASAQERAAQRIQLWSFGHEIKGTVAFEDDWVVMPARDPVPLTGPVEAEDRQVGAVFVGQVDSTYAYLADSRPHEHHRIGVSWTPEPIPVSRFGPDLRASFASPRTVQRIQAARATERLRIVVEEGLPDGYEEGGSLERFSRPIEYVGDYLGEIADEPGVHVVWSHEGELLYVGETASQRTRLRQHLTGDREGSVLHKRFGALLDKKYGRTAERDEITAALNTCTFAWRHVDETAKAKARIMDELAPTFNVVRPATDRRNSFLASISKTTLSNWNLCKQHGLFGIGANSVVAKARAQHVQRGDQILFWLGGRGYAAICTATDPAQPVESGDAVPWPGEYAFTIPMAIDLELDDPVLLKFPDGSQEKTDIPKIAFQAGFWDLDPDQAATIRELMLSGSQRDTMHLLFKWNQDREPRTVLRHKEIADEQGSVWWGKFGARERASLSAKNISKIRDQIASGDRTLAVLYRPGEVWRTDLLELTDDPDAVDDNLLPSYYSKDECELFVRIAGFQELTSDWPINNLVLASNPDPSKMSGALGNQRTPLMVNLRSVLAPEIPVEQEELTFEWLVEKTGWNQERLQDLVDTLKHTRPQVVLAGPPGTSKTWVAKHVARYLAQNPTVRTVQFHPSYGYEEFIEGLRPEVDDAGLLSFKVRPGVVRQIVESIDDPDQVHVLVIDEMNRANLPRVFGELMYLFEYRDDPINLQYTNDFELPENLLFIGTMNTADRSIRSIDIALRRRFDVFECPPESAILEGYYDREGTNDLGNLVEGFEALNAALAAHLDRHHTIGHTFFMVPHMTAKRLSQVWDRQLKPLIEEYFFDQPDIAAEYTFDRFWPGQ